MLVEDVELLPASQLDLVGAAVHLLVFDPRGLAIDLGDLALRKGPRVVLVQSSSRGLSLVEDPVIRV